MSNKAGAHTSTHLAKLLPNPSQPQSAASLRRSSFLSQTMLESESFSIYDSYTFSRGSAAYNIISLKESQGFMFNQDLFATPYQQLRTIAREKRARALSKSKTRRTKSHSSTTRSAPLTSQQRRHTSCDCSPPQLHVVGARLAASESVIEEDSNDDMCLDDISSHKKQTSHTTLESLMTVGSNDSDSNDCSEEDLSDRSEEAEVEFNSLGTYRVPVIDIIVDDKDESLPDI